MNNQLVEIIDVNITSDYVELTASAIEKLLEKTISISQTASSSP